MSELKAMNYFQVESDYLAHEAECESSKKLYYFAADADKVIAELKKERDWLAKDRAQAYDDLEKRAQLNIKQEESIRHHKYKRCLAMAQEWRSYATFCGMQSSCHNHRGFGKTAEKWTWKEFHAWKCVKRWLALAEKFKEVK